MSKNIILRPVVSEKTEKMSESENRYVFFVHNKATKPEIKKAVEEMFEVSVLKVNTCILPRKSKTRYTKTGFLNGKTALRKKAIVTLSENDELDFYGDIDLDLDADNEEEDLD